MLLNYHVTVKRQPLTGLIVLFLGSTESLNVEFVCNVLVVADQLLITRLKEMCEVVITENCTLCLPFPLSSSQSQLGHIFCFSYLEILLQSREQKLWKTVLVTIASFYRFSASYH